MALQKVYWKGARLVLDTARRYLQRNQLNLQANLTTEQYNCIVDTLQAIVTCLGLLPSNTPVE